MGYLAAAGAYLIIGLVVSFILMVREILATEDLNEDALLRIFDGVTAAFYKSDEYNSREYRYSNLSELRKAMKHKGGGKNGKAQ